MSKGSKRRPEDRAAIEKNWPFGKKTKRRQKRASADGPRCPFCYKLIRVCKHCGREHCPCVKLSDCREKRAPKRVGDPKEQSPYGFEVHRHTPDLQNVPAEKDTPPLLNHEFIRSRGRL